MDSDDIITNINKEIEINIVEGSLDLTGDILMSNKQKKKVKKEIFLDKNEITTKLFIFLETIDNIIYVMDSHSFERLLKFREDLKSEKRICTYMFQSVHQKSTLICIHGNKLNINKIKIINTTKSTIYCEQIQSILFGNDYVSIYDLIESKIGSLIIGLEGSLFLWKKTNKIEDINMTDLEERKLIEKILNQNNFPQNGEDNCINIKGNHHYLPNRGIYIKKMSFKNSSNNFLIKYYSIKNILQINVFLIVTLINLNDNISILRFYFVDDNEYIVDGKNDLIINDFNYKGIYITKLFYISEKYFGLINTENIIIVSSQYKQIVSIYLINEIKLLHNVNQNNKISLFIPRCFLIFPDYYFLIQFIDTKTENIFLKTFKLVISKSNNFVDIIHIDKKQIKNDDLIYNFLSFKSVKDHKQKEKNFAAKFFITNNKNNMVKKWIITNYEMD